MSTDITMMSLLLLLRGAYLRAWGEEPLEAWGKLELLAQIVSRHGLQAAFEAGSEIRQHLEHPVVRVFAAAPHPHHLFARWQRLEHFGHASHRTHCTEAEATGMILLHQGSATSSPGVLDNLFVAGVLYSLLEAQGCQKLSLWVGETAVVLEGQRQEFAEVEGDTSCWRWQWKEAGQGKALVLEAPQELEETHWRHRLRKILQRDLLYRWTLAELGRLLAVSSRTLQRRLADVGTSLTEELHRVRIEGACRLLETKEMSLTEIAFCCGFSDSAHFSRIFRRFAEVPPSAYREALWAEKR
ncbi:MAG: helix-turn-helix transcriptional regulator [Myxococcales bacterium]|nr:helix-turn-helix transcriptional regulator [Myxococcales bacterium]MCB9641711.1 helix-turn-helix transcriptional regulator [Myxococcales bacterium]